MKWVRIVFADHADRTNIFFVKVTMGSESAHETFFINRKGKIVGKTFAEKDWTSTSVKTLIKHLLAEDK